MIFAKKAEVSTMSRRYTAFTLAEVLITLAIIGVVAAIIIPTLIANTQKQQYAVGLKKACTNFNQALVKFAADNGCVGDLKCTGMFAPSVTTQDFGDAFVKYFNVIQNCGVNYADAAGNACFPEIAKTNYDGTGGTYNFNSEINYKFNTADGASILLNTYAGNCSTDGSQNNSGPMSQVCGQIWVDVNGIKKPNFYGRDLFLLFITNGRGPSLYPMGGKEDYYGGGDNWWQSTQKCTPVHQDAWQCAGRVIEEGWEMNY